MEAFSRWTAEAITDFSQAGTRPVSELALIVSLYEKNGCDAALERIRKSPGIVYLDHARNNVAKIRDILPSCHPDDNPFGIKTRTDCEARKECGSHRDVPVRFGQRFIVGCEAWLRGYTG
jgi:hypothetical protein